LILSRAETGNWVGKESPARLYNERSTDMLERATIALNAVSVVALIATGTYVITAFSDVVSMGAQVLIGLGVVTYSWNQIAVVLRQANQN
jgi:hypothetical protein